MYRQKQLNLSLKEGAFGIVCLELLFIIVYNSNFFNYLNKLFSHLDSETAKRED